MSERIKALGKYEMLKKELAELGFRAGSHLNSLREQLEFDKQLEEIDFAYVKALINDLEKIQKKVAEISTKMERLNENYRFE